VGMMVVVAVKCEWYNGWHVFINIVFLVVGIVGLLTVLAGKYVSPLLLIKLKQVLEVI